MEDNILELRDISIKIKDREIISGLTLNIPKKSIYVIFGQNGIGKSTLLNAIMGIKGYEVTRGSVVFNKKDITNKSVSARSRLGIALAFQNPAEINGITLRQMLKICLKKDNEKGFSAKEKELIKRFGMEQFLDRNINQGFSGGEKKRAEILQLLLMKPKLLLLDEPDSGVDYESLSLIGKAINSYVKENSASVLMITHSGDMFSYLNVSRACVLTGKSLKCHKNPKKVLEDIKKYGYKKCLVGKDSGIIINERLEK